MDDILQAANGDFLVAGYIEDPVSPFPVRFLVFRLNSAGTDQWLKVYNLDDSTQGDYKTIMELGDGTLLLGCQMYDVNSNNDNTLLLHLESTGDLKS